jgi:4-carboxymuconolactone decarboxylase
MRFRSEPVRVVTVVTLFGVVALAGFGLRAMVAQTPGGNSVSAKVDQFPKDVYPDSRNRLPLVKREDLDEKGKKAYDAAFATTNSIAGLQGEAGIRLHGGREEVRYESPLGRRLTELAIITGAREGEQDFEWTLHSEEALRVGLEISIVDIVRYGKPVTGLGEKETAIIMVGREMAEKHNVTPETFMQAFKALGKSNIVDMVVTMATRANETPLIWADQHLPLDWKRVAPMPINIIPSPPDIFPDSRSRLREMEGQRPGVPGRTLSPDGMGPGQISLHGGGGKFLEANLGRRLMELAILVTARELDQQVEWTFHELEARKQGLEPAIIDIVRYRKPATGLGEKETAIIQAGRELIGKHHVSPETYAHAVSLFGERDALDLASLIGQHAATAGILTAFNQQLPVGQKPLLPIQRK